MPHNRVFGGQVLAQTLIAASATVPSSRPVHSMHGYFLRPGDDTQPIEFSVDRIHDGRSFSTRRTQGLQKGVPIFSMIASFQEVVPGLDHAEPLPTGIPEPESLPEPAELFAELNHPQATYWAAQRPMDIRYVNGPIYVDVPKPNVSHQAVWMRCLDRLPDDASLHRAALAYASDYTILESIYRRHGVAWATEGLRAASLDHAMWFHRDGRADEWVLYVQESPSAQGGRGLCLGRMYSRDGTLLASVAQEGMVRVPN
jgi:acyl-CoA thioesterase-2